MEKKRASPGRAARSAYCGCFTNRKGMASQIALNREISKSPYLITSCILLLEDYNRSAILRVCLINSAPDFFSLIFVEFCHFLSFSHGYNAGTIG